MRRGRTPLSVVVLAAGQGTRMRSKRAKLLHEVAGRPMVRWVVDTVAALRPGRTVAVIGYQADLVRAALDGACDRFALQREQRGTGHAVVQALSHLDARAGGDVLIVNGDLPTLRVETLRRLLAAHRRSSAALTLLTAEIDDPAAYGRIVREDGALRRIVEFRDADAATRRIREINVGIYCADLAELAPALRRLRPDNAQGEYYLTDAVHDLIDRGRTVRAVVHDGAADEILGVNDRAELARATATRYARKAAELMRDGVTLLDPARTWIDPAARIGRDSVVFPDVLVEGACVLGEDCVVRSGSRIARSRIGRGVEIKEHSVVVDARIGDGAAVGPFAHLRPGTRLDSDVKVGNFVETKKARLRRGAKASHLSYIGDADVGEDSNIGAGTITCNYDGTNKHRTVLGRGVFIGSDTQLVAPVKVGDGAFVGAGTTVTRNVPKGALALSRTRQSNVAGWAERRAGRESGAAAASPSRRRGKNG